MLLNLSKEEDRLKIWEKAIKIDGFNPEKYRQDVCGAWIAYSRYGDRNNMYGWEIDHIYPRSRGGNDDERNLRAMHWRNNESKGNDYPHYESVVIADGNRNIDRNVSFTVNEATRKILLEEFGYD
ncbi:MAG: HNH endonuclease domain-containing protein [bacterium]